MSAPRRSSSITRDALTKNPTRRADPNCEGDIGKEGMRLSRPPRTSSFVANTRATVKEAAESTTIPNLPIRAQSSGPKARTLPSTPAQSRAVTNAVVGMVTVKRRSLFGTKAGPPPFRHAVSLSQRPATPTDKANRDASTRDTQFSSLPSQGAPSHPHPLASTTTGPPSAYIREIISPTPPTLNVPVRWESVRTTNAMTARVAHGLANPETIGKEIRASSRSDADDAEGCTQLYYWSRNPFSTHVCLQSIQLDGRRIHSGPSDADIEVVLGLKAVLATSDESLHGIALPADDKERKVWELPAPSTNQSGLTSFQAAVDGDNFAADLVHTFTVARQTLDMLLKDLRMLGVLGTTYATGWRWQWESISEDIRQPLRIIAHSSIQASSAYHRGKRSVQFSLTQRTFQMITPDDPEATATKHLTVYACRSFDVVAHEMAHAILDSLCPSFYKAQGEGEIAGLHEGFADVTAIFVQLERKEVLEYCILAIFEERIRQTLSEEDTPLGDDTLTGSVSLRSSSISFLTCIGQEFADAKMVGISSDMTSGVQPQYQVQHAPSLVVPDPHGACGGGVRDANTPHTKLNGAECGTDSYALANLFSAFVWDIVVDTFDSALAIFESLEKELSADMEAVTAYAHNLLQEIASEVRCLTVAAIISVYQYRTKHGREKERGLFRDISTAMIAIVDSTLSRRSARQASAQDAPRPPRISTDSVRKAAHQRALDVAGCARGAAQGETMRRMLGDY